MKDQASNVSAQALVDYVAKSLSAQKASTGGVSFIDQVPRNAMRKAITRQLASCAPLPGPMGYLQRPAAYDAFR